MASSAAAWLSWVKGGRWETARGRLTEIFRFVFGEEEGERTGFMLRAWRNNGKVPQHAPRQGSMSVLGSSADVSIHGRATRTAAGPATAADGVLVPGVAVRTPLAIGTSSEHVGHLRRTQRAHTDKILSGFRSLPQPGLLRCASR